MITIKCPKCGKPILLIPDGKAMGKAIKEHAERKHKGSAKVETQLIILAFQRAAQEG